jgi:hypothetical protein
MRKRLTAVAIAGTVGLGAVGATVVAYPALADNSTKESPQAGSEAAQKAFKERRIAAIREQLKGLVDDKTLTQEQADKVASTLGGADRPGGPAGPMAGRGFRPGGGGLLGVEGPEADASAAKVLGLSVDDLRTALKDGSTLAALAKKQGKDVDALVTALVAVAKDRLSQEVKAGRITQQTADQIEKTLEQRVRTVVQNGRPAFGGPGGGHGHGWHGGHEFGGGPGQRPDGTAPDGTAPDGATPDAPGGRPSPAPSASAKTSSFDTA